jgi:hypothetical protein
MNEQRPSSERAEVAEVWVRFMAAGLSAAPHAPADKVAAIADEALAEYRRRLDAGRFEHGSEDGTNASSGATATPFVAQTGDDHVTYEPTAEAPTEEEIDSPFRPPSP